MFLVNGPNGLLVFSKWAVLNAFQACIYLLLTKTYSLFHSFYTFKTKYHLIVEFYLKVFLILRCLTICLLLIFCYHTLQILIKTLFLYLSLQPLGFYFVFFYIHINKSFIYFLSIFFCVFPSNLVFAGNTVLS